MKNMQPNNDLTTPVGLKRTHSLEEIELWQTLLQHANRLKTAQLKELFRSSPERIENHTLQIRDVHLDYSKNLIDSSAFSDLLKLADACHLKIAIEQLFKGERINNTENRSVLHTLLRYPSNTKEPFIMEGKDLLKEVLHERQKMEEMVNRLHEKKWLGATNKPITDVVNLGIGGSDLGPMMAVEALKPYHTSNIGVYFVSNIDPVCIHEILSKLNPETTLFILSSKSFTTEETLVNAAVAKIWLKEHLNKVLTHLKEEDLNNHFIAITSNPNAALSLNIKQENILKIWDWVGGRYSVWSSIGLPLAIKIGVKQFEEFLGGAHALDQHFKTKPWRENIPVIMAMLHIWQSHFWGAHTHVVVPYSERMKHFVSYLQQLDMESNGKSIDFHGQKLNYPTGSIVWGGIGTNSQHAFFQLMHQGQHNMVIDFILPLLPEKTEQKDMHTRLVAHCLAQRKALMIGRNANAVSKPQEIMPGNRSSNLLYYPRLTPETLGVLIALYEHKVFTQGVIWNINSFDQPGVELGKKLAQDYYKALSNTLMQDEQEAAQFKAFLQKSDREY